MKSAVLLFCIIKSWRVMVQAIAKLFPLIFFKLVTLIFMWNWLCREVAVLVEELTAGSKQAFLHTFIQLPHLTGIEKVRVAFSYCCMFSDFRYRQLVSTSKIVRQWAFSIPLYDTHLFKLVPKETWTQHFPH